MVLSVSRVFRWPMMVAWCGLLERGLEFAVSDDQLEEELKAQTTGMALGFC